jgi:DNA polymerase-3 subunit delta'
MLIKGAIPPSMLFSGPENCGKKDFAVKLMMTLNCLQKNGPGLNPCGICKNCRRIQSFVYPDFIITEPEGKSIKIGRIRQLKEKLTLKPHEAKKRIVLITDADLLGINAANALLKIMEEPPVNTFFILTVKNYMDTLPTIRSRCYNFNFFSFDTENRKNIGFNPDYFNNSDFSEKKETGQIYSLIEKLSENRFRSCSQIIFISEYICSGKEITEFFFTLILLFFRDMVVYKDNKEYIYLKTIEKSIANTAQTINNKKLFKIIDIILTVQNRLKTNVNSKILIQSSLLKIQAVINE